MQSLLSFDQAPPLAGPLRFFLTAPAFAAGAGLLLLLLGPGLLASRWTPGALAFTHLLTAGFMLQTMVGALLQILPVATGAGVEHPLGVARAVHGLFTGGLLLLLGGFLSFRPLYFQAAVGLFAAGLLIFLWAAGRALARVPASSPIQWALKLAAAGLAITVLLGLVLASALGFSLPWPLLQITGIHLSWGLVGWGVLLLSGVAYVVVPMFLLTPSFPGWLSRILAPGLFLALALWSGAEAAGLALAPWLGGVLMAGCGVFAGVTLWLLVRSKRARLDATHRYWRLGLGSGLAALTLLALGLLMPSLGGWNGWPLLFGVLILVGGFMSVISGMLYKIVPFLIWLHLQNAGQGQVLAPNMKKIMPESAMGRQMACHAAALALLAAAVLWPEWLARPAGAALLVSSLWLMRNLIGGVQVYRRHLQTIRGQLAASS
ncbi:hypothetical protein AZSI13_02570 [Azospira sp. I13]|uniref:hypothetical protein n=1 Tax=Azospira sp. I13 TaxID=1765050 RepID=UPI000D4E9435|nr:hypothetical protein [Azospira sp. I13]GBG00930.1 hypothetical protein AZSI13_02570 [Azospira sp. I13]